MHADIAALTNPRRLTGTLSDALEGRTFIGVSAPRVMSQDMVRLMADDPIVFAMANPVPEIMPDEAIAAGAAVAATGRSDFPNQINNVLAFPGIFRGALDVCARDIDDDMMVAAAHAIAAWSTTSTAVPTTSLPMHSTAASCPPWRRPSPPPRATQDSRAPENIAARMRSARFEPMLERALSYIRISAARPGPKPPVAASKSRIFAQIVLCGRLGRGRLFFGLLLGQRLGANTGPVGGLHHDEQHETRDEERDDRADYGAEPERRPRDRHVEDRQHAREVSPARQKTDHHADERRDRARRPFP